MQPWSWKGFPFIVAVTKYCVKTISGRKEGFILPHVLRVQFITAAKPWQQECGVAVYRA